MKDKRNCNLDIWFEDNICENSLTNNGLYQSNMPRDFKGIWIPKEIYLDKRLSAIDKMVLAEINSLCNDDTGCYASNEYLAYFCQCSPSKISKSISKLKDLGYVSIIGFDGRKRMLKTNFKPSKK